MSADGIDLFADLRTMSMEQLEALTRALNDEVRARSARRAVTGCHLNFVNPIPHGWQLADGSRMSQEISDRLLHNNNSSAYVDYGTYTCRLDGVNVEVFTVDHLTGEEHHLDTGATISNMRLIKPLLVLPGPEAINGLSDACVDTLRVFAAAEEEMKRAFARLEARQRAQQREAERQADEEQLRRIWEDREARFPVEGQNREIHVDE